MSVAAPAIPPKPKMAATIAIARKITAHSKTSNTMKKYLDSTIYNLSLIKIIKQKSGLGFHLSIAALSTAYPV